MKFVPIRRLPPLAVATVASALVACSSSGDGSVVLLGGDSGGAIVLLPASAHDGGADTNTMPPAAVTASSSSSSAAIADAAPPHDASSANHDASSATTSAPPDATTPDVNTSAGGFDQFQQRNLADINMYRATLGVAPLVLDQTLSTFAMAGSVELSQDHSPHAHFISAENAGTIWTSGFNTSAGENQGDPNGWTVLSNDPTTDELDQIDAIQQSMFDEGPGAGEAHGHYTNMMNSAFTKVGVGLLEVNGQLYLTNDFSN